VIIRQGLNFAVHFTAGIVVGVLAVVAMAACRQRNRDDFWDGGDAIRPDVEPQLDPEPPLSETH
jgi:hypothetical protein